MSKISVGSSVDDIISTIKCTSWALTVDDLRQALRDEQRGQDRKALVKFLEQRIRKYEKAGKNPYADKNPYA